MVSQEKLEQIVRRAKKKMRPFVEGAILLGTGAFIGYISKDESVSPLLAAGGISAYTTLEISRYAFSRKRDAEEKMKDIKHTLFRYYITLGSAGVAYYFYS